MSSTSSTNKFTKFLQNNAAILLVAFCIIAIATVVLVSSLTEDVTPPDDKVVVTPPSGDDTGDEPVVPDPPIEKVKIYYASPVNYASVGMEYTNGEDVLFVFNQTLQTWKTHKGVDLVADDQTQVVAMFDGTVVEVSQSYGMGNVVKIDHGNNVVATYASLGEVKVTNGQNVAKGEQIGVVSTTASYEFDDGAHLHLEVAVNGVPTDPMPYVNGEIFVEQEKE